MSVYRRGAVYWWGRTVALGNGPVETIRLRVSLKTSDKSEAKRRAAMLEVELDMVAVRFPVSDPTEAHEVCRELFDLRSWIWSNADQPSELAKESITRWWLFLLAGRMRPGQIDLLWPNGFFHGVEGHDPVLKDNGH